MLPWKRGVYAFQHKYGSDSLVGITKANEWGWGSAQTIGLLAAGVTLMIFTNAAIHMAVVLGLLFTAQIGSMNIATGLTSAAHASGLRLLMLGALAAGATR